MTNDEIRAAAEKYMPDPPQIADNLFNEYVIQLARDLREAFIAGAEFREPEIAKLREMVRVMWEGLMHIAAQMDDDPKSKARETLARVTKLEKS